MTNRWGKKESTRILRPPRTVAGTLDETGEALVQARRARGRAEVPWTGAGCFSSDREAHHEFPQRARLEFSVLQKLWFHVGLVHGTCKVKVLFHGLRRS